MERVFNHTAHKALWNWLSENPDKEKSDWPGWEWNGGKHKDTRTNLCFACMYDNEIEGYCYNCPLDWPNGMECVSDDDSLYPNWHFCQDLQRRAELAAQIRDLPVREGVKCR